MAAARAAERASGRWLRRSLITSREAPTMARWDLTVRRERFLATSYIGKAVSCCSWRFITSGYRMLDLGGMDAPQRFPSCVDV